MTSVNPFRSAFNKIMNPFRPAFVSNPFINPAVPSLDLNFITSYVLDSRITFTRASNAGYFNAAGLWTIAGSNVPRFDHHPTTLTPRGLLVEPQRTNLLLWNRDLTNAAWTASNVTVAKTATGIDGVANSASQLTATSDNGTVLQGVTSGSAARATSAYVRRVSGSGTVRVTQNGGTNWTDVVVTSSWTRVGPASATITNPSVGFQLATSGDVIEVDYVQLENGNIPSSAILTTTASATRAVDNIIAANLVTLGYNANEGTFVVEAELHAASGMTFVSVDDGSNANRFLMRVSSGGNYNVQVTTGGISQVNSNAGMLSGGVIQKVAMAYKANDVAFVSNGGTVTVDASVTLPAVSTLRLGNNLAGTEPLGGWLRKVTYYPQRLANGQLQAF
jgi:hypothetical protein